jgi:arginase
MKASQIVVLDAPSNLGLRPPRPGAEPGVRGLAAALRQHDIVARLGATDAGALVAPAYRAEREPQTGFRNGPAIAEFTIALAGRVGELLDGSAFPLVLGGDCSILLGAVLALRRRGRYGLAFLDGHDDYSYARDAARYHGLLAAAGLDLALATGHGPDALCDIDELRPYIAEPDVIQLGLQREPEDLEYFRTEMFDESTIARIPSAEIRSGGAGKAAAEARGYLESRGLDGFWIHLDVDILHRDVMPAVDSPNPNGISLTDLEAILTGLLASPAAVGAHVGIYDPELDPTGVHGTALVHVLIGAFSSAR